MKSKVIVVDLDGTLYTINTFHYFMKFLLKYSIKNFDLNILLTLIFAAILRLLKVSTHAQMKFAILRAIAKNTDIDYRKFVNLINSKKRNIDILNNGDFAIKILATAAPSCYAHSIAIQEKFHICLGTDFPVSGFHDEFENIKEVKKKSVSNYLDSKNLTEIDVLVTDHIDDLPLMKIATKTIIIAPSSQLKKQLEAHQIQYEIIE